MLKINILIYIKNMIKQILLKYYLYNSLNKEKNFLLMDSKIFYL